jgi:MarR family 2-MHQ and catechol resistance regulon transcriptional repressor
MTAMKTLERQRILITGGSRGLGLGVVEALVARQAKVTVIARDSARLTELKARLGVSIIPGDATDPMLAESVLRDVRPSVLLLNAGATPAMAPLTRYAAAGIEETGLGLSDFGVLEVLLHKGPLPVNTIGPIVDLTPGSISIAVDRLFEKGLVSRVESTEDRRVRIVALTPGGKDLIVSAFRKHSGQMKRVLSELSPQELRGLEVALKKVGKRAAALMEPSS